MPIDTTLLSGTGTVDKNDVRDGLILPAAADIAALQADVETLQGAVAGLEPSDFEVVTVAEYAAMTLEPGVGYSIEPAVVATEGDLPTPVDDRWDGTELTVGSATPEIWRCLPDGAGGRAWRPAATLTASPEFDGVQIGDTLFLTEIDGDAYLSVNAYYNGSDWLRVDVTAPAYRAQFNVANPMDFESYKAHTLWIASAAANPIGAIATVGGWELAYSMSQYRDFTLGGGGIEVDGHSSVEQFGYGRFQSATIGGVHKVGLEVNQYLDESGRDRPLKPSWQAGFQSDGATDRFVIARGAGGVSWPGWTELLTLSSSGNLSASVTATGATASRALAARFADRLSVRDFGAVGDGVADDTAEIQAALDAAAAAGGGIVHLPDQHYVVTATLEIPDGVTLVGRGVGLWDAVFHDRDKTWEGTNLLFKGTGANSHSFRGITSGADNGGTVTVGGVTAKLLSFMNADASGATRATAKSFSVAIKPKTANGSRHWGLKNLRVVPHDTANGLAEYSDETSTSLGDDWDVGVLLQDAEYVQLENVQVVGYWRMAGLLIATPGLDDYGKGERNRFIDCKFQGFCGVSIRATDLWKVTGTTASSLTIRHNSEHYWPTSGTFESTESGTDFTYSGLSYSAPGLTFTGVSPDPTGKTQIRALKRGSGMAGTQFLDCMIHGLDHVSGVAATALGFTDPSKAAEISGFPIRGLQFFNTKCQTDEGVCLHLHEVDDLLMFGSQFETGGTGHMIASPLESSSTATAPAGQSYNLRWYATAMSGVTTTGFTPRTILDDWRQLAPGDGFSSDLVLAALSGQDAVVQMASAKNFRVKKSDGSTTVLRATETGNVLIENGGQLSLSGSTGYLNVDASQNLNIRNSTTARLTLFGSSGNWGAGADNTQSWGTASFRWSSVYATQIRPGDGSPIWTSGSGTPEGAVTAPVGSMFLRTDGSTSTTLYIKTSGSGSAGWTAK